MLRGADGGKSFDSAGATIGDQIDVSGIDANAGITGNQAFVWGVAIGRIAAIETGNAATLVRANTDSVVAFEFRAGDRGRFDQRLSLHRGRLIL